MRVYYGGNNKGDMAGIKPRALCMLGKNPITELNPQPSALVFKVNSYIKITKIN